MIELVDDQLRNPERARLGPLGSVVVVVGDDEEELARNLVERHLRDRDLVAALGRRQGQLVGMVDGLEGEEVPDDGDEVSRTASWDSPPRIRRPLVIVRGQPTKCVSYDGRSRPTQFRQYV